MAWNCRVHKIISAWKIVLMWMSEVETNSNRL
jgi:hypothetical protein